MFFNASISGDLKLNYLDLIRQDFILSSINVSTNFSRSTLQTKTLKSNLEFTNTSVTGNLVIGLKNKSINFFYQLLIH